MELAEFIEARLAEDEAAAKAAIHTEDGDTGRWYWHGADRIWDPQVSDKGGETVVYDEGRPSDEQSEHIARHDPARVLRDVEATRRIMELHGPHEVNFTRLPPGITDRAEMERIHRETPKRVVCATCMDRLRQVPYPCPTLRLIAQRWADHDDFNPAWSPDATVDS